MNKSNQNPLLTHTPLIKQEHLAQIGMSFSSMRDLVFVKY